MVDQAGCVAYSSSIDTSYGYRPSLAAGVVFTVLFTLSTVIHVYQLIPTRAWWQVVFVIGGVGEILGWAARVAAFKCPYNITLFQIQLACLIISPNFFTAGFYIALSRLVGRLGRQYSPISPRLYLYIFCACDIISLVIQSIGGGSASAAFNKEPPGNPKPGTNTMVGGIAFQLVSILVFAGLFARVIWTARTRLKEVQKIKLVTIATGVSVLMMIIRGIYRTIELAQGWTGFLIRREGYFIGLDGVTMILAVAVFNLYNPGSLLNVQQPEEAAGGNSRSRYEREKKGANETGNDQVSGNF